MYNGHKNWNHWNVSLWLNNDEHLYRTMRSIRRRHSRADDAAESMRVLLCDLGMEKTPDGALYSRSAIRAAMADLRGRNGI